MSLTAFLKEVIKELESREVSYALLGGIVASFYRKSPRATDDIDILIFAAGDSEKMAKEIIIRFGLKVHLLRQADLEGGPMFAIKRKTSKIFIISGRSDRRNQIGLDFLMPAIPWASEALERAQDNKIDFGFGPLPCLTVEDIVVAKLHALKNQSSRFMDLDDLKAIFESKSELDLEYLCSKIVQMALPVPATLKPFAPKIIFQISKRKSL